MRLEAVPMDDIFETDPRADGAEVEPLVVLAWISAEPATSRS